MGSSSRVEQSTIVDSPDDLEKTSRLSNENLKPLLAALQRAKAEEARAAASGEFEITQKMDPEVIVALREHFNSQDASHPTPPPMRPPPEAVRPTNAAAFATAMATLPKVMHDQVMAALTKAQARLTSVPEAFALNAVQGELARAITSGYLYGLLTEIGRPTFVEKITRAYASEQSGGSEPRF